MIEKIAYPYTLTGTGGHKFGNNLIQFSKWYSIYTSLYHKIPFTNRKIFSALEIAGEYVKLAQAEDVGGSRKIIKLIVRKSTSPSEDDIAAALKNIIDELKGQTGHLTVCIPRHKVTVRFLRFPTVNEKEIADMVGLQSAKELPFSKEELISDYLITERTKDGYAKIALVIVHQDAVNGYLGILKKAALQPQRITLSTEAILDWYGQAIGQKNSKGCAILVDLDTDNTDIVILDNSHLAFTRGLNFGIAQLKGQVDLKNKLIEEIRRTIEGYSRQEKAKKAERVFLGPATESIEGLKPFLAQEFDLPCEIVSALKNLTCEKGISAGQYKLEVSPLRVLGTVLNIKKKGLNLLPIELGQKQKLTLRKKIVFTTFILLSASILLGLVVFAKKVHDKQLRIFYLDREIRKTAPLAKEVEDMLKKIKLIEKRAMIEGSSIDVLRELHQLVPPDISLSSFNYDEEDKMVTIQGVSTNMSEIFKFIDSLEKSDYFMNVQLKYVSEKKAKAGGFTPLEPGPLTGFTDFKIEANLEQ